MDTLAHTNQVLRNTNSALKLDHVEDTMEQARENLDESDARTKAISEPLTQDFAVTDDDFDEEMARLRVEAGEPYPIAAAAASYVSPYSNEPVTVSTAAQMDMTRMIDALGPAPSTTLDLPVASRLEIVVPNQQHPRVLVGQGNF